MPNMHNMKRVVESPPTPQPPCPPYEYYPMNITYDLLRR